MNEHSPISPHAVPDAAVFIAIVNAITQWLPVAITITAGLLGIVCYSLALYDRFWKKPGG